MQGTWSEQELYVLAKESGVVAQEGTWKCNDLKTGGGYGRLLVDCPDLRSMLLREGYAHPFSVEKPAPQKDLDDLNYAIENKKGFVQNSMKIVSLHNSSRRNILIVTTVIIFVSRGLSTNFSTIQ